MSRLLNMAIREHERGLQDHFNERQGLVTSYDANSHHAKVTYMPNGEESGWLPIEASHVGNGWGVLQGLTPGSGAGSGGGGAGAGGSGGGSGYSGDQVTARMQEGNLDAGSIVKTVHSAVDKPPLVNSGEYLTMHSLGARTFFKKDGSVHFYDRTSSQTDQSSSDSSGGGGGGGGPSPLKGPPPLQPQSVKMMFDGKGKMTVQHFQQNGRQSGQDSSDPTSTKSPQKYHEQVTDGTNLQKSTTTWRQGQGSSGSGSGGSSSGGSGGGGGSSATNGDPGMDSSSQQSAKMFSQIVHDSNKGTLTHTTYDAQGQKKFQTTMNTESNVMRHEAFSGGQSVGSTEWDDKGNIAHNCKGTFSCNAPQMQSTGNWQHNGHFQGTDVTATNSMGASTAAFGKLAGGPGGTAAGFTGAAASPLAGGSNI